MLIKSFNLKKYLLSIALPLSVGGLATLLSYSSVRVYDSFNKPLLSPPAWLFPVVWTLLYILMGTAEYIVKQKSGYKGSLSQKLYFLQLFFNFCWPIVFFSLGAVTPAVFVLALLFVFSVLTLVGFLKFDKTSALLLVPYILWLSFAGYLNVALALLN